MEPKYKIGDIVKLKNGKLRTIAGYEVWSCLGVAYFASGLFQARFDEGQIVSKVGHNEDVY